MVQHVKFENQAGKQYMASRSSKRFIHTPQDILDLLACGNENETNLFLLEETNFISEFYDLKTGLAGEILQKISTYRARQAIVGSFEMAESKKFGEVMVELNKGSQVRFARTKEEAVSWLMQ
ncbi:MAG: DUF4180 domain-containing protein [Ignavibacteriales bacterium]|nr:DUF4180 domain-containing protein [Ignavibacteriales bacterium]